MVHENLIRGTLERLNCSADVFCALVGTSPTRWSRALRGLAPLTGPECMSFSKMAEEMSELASDCEPIPVSFRNVTAIQILLEHRRNGLRWVATVVEEKK
jgi:hypothetical protein